MPILVLLLAFYIVSTSAEVSWWRIVVSGIVAGCSISGMHFIGNISISNYHCTYATINIIGAGIIAIAASIIALSLFFVFRAAWTSTWWKRLGCSVVLAGAVSGMHWCAAVGTTFRLVHLKQLSESNGRNMTVIVVSCLVRLFPTPPPFSRPRPNRAACLVCRILSPHRAPRHIVGPGSEGLRDQGPENYPRCCLL